MSMVCGLDLHRGQITFDALEVEPARCGGAGSGRRTGPGSVAGWPTSWRPSARRAGGGGGGGLHRVALCGRGDHRRGFRGACGRAGRHPGGPGPQEARQDRPLPTPGCCGSCCRPGSCPRAWIPPEAVLEWRERTVLYKRCSISAGCGSSASTPSCSSTAWRCPRARSARRADPGLAGRRRRGSSAAAARQRIAVGYRMLDATDAELVPLRASSTGSGDASRPVRPWPPPTTGSARSPRCGVGRAGRLSTILPLHAGGAPHRPGRDRGLVRPPPRPAATCPARAPRRCAGRCSRPARARPRADQPRPRLLPGGQTSPRRQAGRHRHGPQARPALLPHPAGHRPRRGLRHAA